MSRWTTTVKQVTTAMLVVVVVLAVVSPEAVHGGLFGWFKHDYQPKNTFVYPAPLPYSFRRVAVLPLTPENNSGVEAVGCQMLGPVLTAELIKTKQFEVVSVKKSVLRRCTGRLAWSGAETLPTNFLSSLREVYGCDAVMFCELTVFHAYPPLAIGWRLKLVNVKTRNIIWSADEVFDASNPSVARGAKDFVAHGTSHNELWTIKHSPRLFGHYTAATLLACLPQR